MKPKILVGAAFATLTVFCARAFPAAPGVPRQPMTAEQRASTLGELQQARTETQRNIQLGAHGVMLIHYQNKESRLDELIQRLQRGETVDPEEIDRVMRR